MEHSELLRFVTSVLERLRVRYVVTGSTATIFYGEPRLTNDIDIVARVRPQHVAAFVAAFPAADFYVDEQTIREAIQQAASAPAGGATAQFNIIHPASGLKVDVIIPADTPFEQSRFARALRVHPAPNYEATFAAPEDVVLRKLEYYRAGGSEKHLRDVTGVLKVSGDKLDYSYLDEWAARLGVAEIWAAVRQRAGG